MADSEIDIIIRIKAGQLPQDLARVTGDVDKAAEEIRRITKILTDRGEEAWEKFGAEVRAEVGKTSDVTKEEFLEVHRTILRIYKEQVARLKIAEEQKRREVSKTAQIVAKVQKQELGGGGGGGRIPGFLGAGGKYSGVRQFATDLAILSVTAKNVVRIIRELIGVFDYLAKTAVQDEEDIRRLANALETLTPDALGAAKAVFQLSEELEEYTRFTSAATMEAAKFIASMSRLKDVAQIKEAVRTAQDLAVMFEGTLADAAKDLARALRDPGVSLEALNKAGIELDDTMKNYLQTLVETNRLSEAQAVVLDLINSRIAGQAEGEVGTYRQAWAQVSESFRELIGRIGQELLPVLEELATELRVAFEKDPQFIKDTIEAMKALNAIVLNLVKAYNLLADAKDRFNSSGDLKDRLKVEEDSATAQILDVATAGSGPSGFIGMMFAAGRIGLKNLTGYLMEGRDLAKERENREAAIAERIREQREEYQKRVEQHRRAAEALRQQQEAEKRRQEELKRQEQERKKRLEEIERRRREAQREQERIFNQMKRRADAIRRSMETPFEALKRKLAEINELHRRGFLTFQEATKARRKAFEEFLEPEKFDRKQKDLIDKIETTREKLKRVTEKLQEAKNPEFIAAMTGLQEFRRQLQVSAASRRRKDRTVEELETLREKLLEQLKEQVDELRKLRREMARKRAAAFGN